MYKNISYHLRVGPANNSEDNLAHGVSSPDPCDIGLPHKLYLGVINHSDGHSGLAITSWIAIISYLYNELEKQKNRHSEQNTSNTSQVTIWSQEALGKEY